MVDWEEEHGMIPDNAVVCLYTGQSKFWGDENKYFGRPKDALQNDTDIHFPGFSPEAAQWLVDERYFYKYIFSTLDLLLYICYHIIKSLHSAIVHSAIVHHSTSWFTA